MALTHFLITRFNIVQSWYFNCAKSGRGTTIQTTEWLDNRFMLFEKYCFPSVKEQTASFTWLVLFNSETPDFYKQRIVAYQQQMPNFVPLYLEPYGDEFQIVREYIDNHCQTDTLLTTRMDNDDMLHADYLTWIQQAAKPTDHRQILNYAEGYQYDVPRKVLYRMYYPDNHYFSVLEPYAFGYHTCLGIDHSDLSLYGEYVELPANNGGGWIEVLHSHNVANHRLCLAPVWRFPCTRFAAPLPFSGCFFVIDTIRFKTRRYRQWFTHKFDKHVVQRLKRIFRQ